MSVNIPAASSPGAWSRGQQRASAHVTQPMIGTGGHAHADVHARLDEHHQRLLNLENGGDKT